MNLKYIQFVAVIFWGMQTDLLAFAIPMAFILEGHFHIPRRWALTKQDFYRTADLTSLGLVAMVIFLFINRSDYHFITTLLQWLPILFFPLVTILAYSTTARMPLDVLFYSLRRQKAPLSQSWDMNYVFFGMCLLSAGTNTDSAGYYIVLCGALIFTALYRLRSSRYEANVFVLSVCIVFLAGMLAHQTIRGAHLAVKEQSRQWLASYFRDRPNVLKTKSAMGMVGRLKSSDEIVFRVRPLTDNVRPLLLQEASYNITSHNDWMILNPQFSPVPHTDDFRWGLESPDAGQGRPGVSAARAKVYLEFNRDTDIVPIPASVTEIYDLPAAEIKKSMFGSIQATGLVPSPGYEVTYDYVSNINSDPDNFDLLVPAAYKEVLSALTKNAGAEDDPLAMIYRTFHDFRYSLYQELASSADPLMHFLTQSKAGHCEYFASATVMLLRHLGVPARYVVGYSVQEYNETLGIYLVRKRHAHAWAIGYIGGQWRVVDTTPQVWAEREAAQSAFLRPVADMLSNLSFVVTLWWSEQRLEDYEVALYVIGALLVIILIYRISTSEQVIIDKPGTGPRERGTWPGLDSPFFRIEAFLTAVGLAREAGESFRNWSVRIGHPELIGLLPIHNRFRFDPRGVDAREAAQLESAVTEWLDQHEDEVESADISS